MCSLFFLEVSGSDHVWHHGTRMLVQNLNPCFANLKTIPESEETEFSNVFLFFGKDGPRFRD